MVKKIFDEYVYKNNIRIKIKYLRNSEARLNPWEITNFVSRISTYMYKIELINTVAMAINEGIELKNIFVLDKAYKLNGNYRNFSEIKLDSLELNDVFAIGKPEGMVPNSDLIAMKLLFEMLYKTNQILYRYGRYRITRSDRSEAYNVMKKEGFFYAIEYVMDVALDKVADEERISVYDKIESECNKIQKKYQKYLDDGKAIESLEDKFESGYSQELTKAEADIERRYFKRFYDLFVALPRPVVGIYYEEENKFRILCADHFDSEIDKKSKIDLKSITQNSPIMGEIEAGCAILALRRDEKRKEEIHELEKEKLKLEIEVLKKEKELKKQEGAKNELDILNKTIELKCRLDALAENEENHGIKRMATSYASRQIGVVYGKIQNGYNDVLQTNKFQEDSISVVDVRV